LADRVSKEAVCSAPTLKAGGGGRKGGKGGGGGGGKGGDKGEVVARGSENQKF
jgi:hypothetical protein